MNQKSKNNPEMQKNCTTVENFQKNFHKNVCRRVYDPLHLNLTMSSLGAEEPQPRTKTQRYKIKKTKPNTNIYEPTHKSKIQPHPLNSKATHIQQIFTRPRTQP